jgi:uncharacterized protein DUF3365
MEPIFPEAWVRKHMIKAHGGLMTRWTALKVGGALTLLCVTLTIPLGEAAEISNDQAVRYILAMVKAFRTTYVRSVVDRLKNVGIESKADWIKDDHAIMLPFEFVKQGGAQIKRDVQDVDIGLISLTPIDPSNLPKTPAEREALTTLVADSKRTILTFGDGSQYKGLAADLVIDQMCADCHNQHPKSPKKDFKQGDVMGAIVVRIKQ